MKSSRNVITGTLLIVVIRSAVLISSSGLQNVACDIFIGRVIQIVNELNDGSRTRETTCELCEGR